MLMRKLALLFTLILTTAGTTSAAGPVDWSRNVEAALQQANQSGQMVFLKFTAEWCGYCQKMERETFTRPAVGDLVNKHFVPVLVDADQHKDLVKHLQIRGLPAMLVVSSDMVILKRISGYQTEENLLPVLQDIVAQNASKSSAGTAPAVRPVSQQTAESTATVNSGSNPFTASPSNAAERTSGPARKSAAEFERPAFGGLCLPGVSSTRSLLSGRPELAMNYRGKILHFSSEEQMTSFSASPETYWPQIDGTCPVTLLDMGRTVEGKLEYAAMFRKKLWLTDSAETLKRFVADPARYVDSLPVK